MGLHITSICGPRIGETMENLFDAVKKGIVEIDIEGAEKYCKTRKVVDIFPFLIKDGEKFDQLSVTYQKVLDREIQIQQFELFENKFISMVLNLWSVNTSYVMICPGTAFNKSIVIRRSKNRLRAFLHSNCKFDRLTEIQSASLMTDLVRIATREAGEVRCIFLEQRIILRISGLCALVSTEDEDMDSIIQTIVNGNQLFLREIQE